MAKKILVRMTARLSEGRSAESLKRKMIMICAPKRRTGQKPSRYLSDTTRT